MTKRADEDMLGDLHVAIAQELLNRIRNGEATASDIQAAIKFLQNNNITATPEQNPALDQIRDAVLPNFDEEPAYEEE